MEHPAKTAFATPPVSSRWALLLTVLISAALTLLLCAGLTEIFLRRMKNTNEPLTPKSLRADPQYGWDTLQSMRPLQSHSPSGTCIYFVGDSFTQDAQWPDLTKKLLAKKGMPTEGYVLGVSGYGTVQEYLKVKESFGIHHPKIVLLLFFAWNDPRDNWNRPAIYYSAETRHRTYLEATSSGVRVLRPTPTAWYEHWEVYKVLYLKLEALGAIALNALGGPDFWNYSYRGSWEPFYQTQDVPSEYRENAWKATETAFTELKSFLDSQNSRLIVLGIDNAFTVDRDVYDAQMKIKNSPLDTQEPLRRLKEILDRHHIPFVNCLPRLQVRAKQLGGKIYKGPPGNLSGHLLPAGEEVLSQAAMEAVLRPGS